MPQFVKITTNFATVATKFIAASLKFIKLFQDRHGDDNVVAAKGKKSSRVVEQYVGIEYEGFLFGVGIDVSVSCGH